MFKLLQNAIIIFMVELDQDKKDLDLVGENKSLTLLLMISQILSDKMQTSCLIS
jgi:hypothetical protein